MKILEENNLKTLGELIGSLIADEMMSKGGKEEKSVTLKSSTSLEKESSERDYGTPHPGQ